MTTIVKEHQVMGECCIGAVRGPSQRLIEFTAIYTEEGFYFDDHRPAEDEEFVIRHVLDVDPSLDTEALRETLQEHTGVGRSGEAGYFAKSVDGLEPEINEEWC